MSKRILIVDDAATVRQQVQSVLANAGYSVVEATDGQQGLEALRTHKDVAVAVCDVNMPRMNGLEMLERAKSEGLLDSVAVIMLTTEDDPDLIEKARGFGAKGWMVKPFKTDMLLSVAEKLTA